MQAEEVAEVAEAASIDYESYSSSLTEAIDGMLTEAGENPSAISRDFIFNLSSNDVGYLLELGVYQRRVNNYARLQPGFVERVFKYRASRYL